MEEKSVKIFVTYKEKHRIFKNNIITPIQTGRAIADEVFEGMIGDDTGENVSIENPKYNELSAQYWAWKNYENIGNPEYIGFMHYRRHFIFNKNFEVDKSQRWLNQAPIYYNQYSQETLDNLNNEHILETLSNNADCYAIKPYNIRLFRESNLYMKEHYLKNIPGAKREVWDAFYAIFSEKYPEYKDILEKFSYGNTIICCNMFIMKKDLFFRYSEFCFNILKELDNRVDSFLYTPQEQRFIGYIGEYVLTLFLMILEKENKNIKFLDAILIKDLDQKIIINSKFSKKHLLKNIFSVTNSYDNQHKILTLLGVKLKFKRKKFLRHNELKHYERMNNIILKNLLIKVSELQEEVIDLKKQLKEKNKND